MRWRFEWMTNPFAATVGTLARPRVTPKVAAVFAALTKAAMKVFGSK